MNHSIGDARRRGDRTTVEEVYPVLPRLPSRHVHGLTRARGNGNSLREHDRVARNGGGVQAGPPVFADFPLGATAGRPHDAEMQRSALHSTLEVVTAPATRGITDPPVSIGR